MAGSHHFTYGTFYNCGVVPNLSSVSTFTFAFWFYRSSAGLMAMVEKAAGATFASVNDSLLMLYSDNVWYVGVNSGAQWGTLSGYTATGWHHAALTFDGSISPSTSRAKLYLDGALQTLAGTRTFGSTTNANAGPFLIGRDFINGIYNSTGVCMCDMQIFSQALTATQVVGVMHRPFDYPYTPLAHWPMTDDLASGQPDIVGNNDGTLTGTKGFSALSPNRAIGRFR